MSSTRQTTRRASSTEQSSSRPQGARLGVVRAGVQELFTGRSTVGRARSHSRETPESPKTPRQQIFRPIIGLRDLPTPRFNIPYLTRSQSLRSQRSHHSNHSQSSITPLSPHAAESPFNTQPIAPFNSIEQQSEQHDQLPPQARHTSSDRFVGVDPAESALAELAQDGRRRRRKTRTSRSRDRRCAPKIKNKKIRSKILSCFISGLFLTLVLTIYLGLALSNKNESQEFHVLLILVILITTIFFCHSLIRLCMMIVNPPSELDLERGLPQMIGPGGYAIPERPVRVTLARDEEAAGINNSEAIAKPPPAYGLWRGSVRVDPNRIFWQRNEDNATNSSRSRAEPRPTANRPPSYASDDGIDYVLEAQPRSIAPTTDVPLPPHPSEIGRNPVWTRPAM